MDKDTMLYHIKECQRIIDTYFADDFGLTRSQEELIIAKHSLLNCISNLKAEYNKIIEEEQIDNEIKRIIANAENKIKGGD